MKYSQSCEHQRVWFATQDCVSHSVQDGLLVPPTRHNARTCSGRLDRRNASLAYVLQHGDYRPNQEFLHRTKRISAWVYITTCTPIFVLASENRVALMTDKEPSYMRPIFDKETIRTKRVSKRSVREGSCGELRRLSHLSQSTNNVPGHDNRLVRKQCDI